MILIILFRIIMIFPFIVYFLALANGCSKKKSRLISASFYLLSMYFITAYIFDPTKTWVILISVNLGLLIIAIFKLRSKYHTIIFNHILREYFNTLGLFFPFMYGGLMIYGIIKEYLMFIA